MINVDLNQKTTLRQQKCITEEVSKTRKEIKKEKICKRCGLEAKKLFNTKTAGPLGTVIAKMDWVTITIHMVIASALCLLASLIALEIVKKT